jgi:hypothetical protein
MITDKQARALGFVRMTLGFVRGYGHLVAVWTLFLPEVWRGAGPDPEPGSVVRY